MARVQAHRNTAGGGISISPVVLRTYMPPTIQTPFKLPAMQSGGSSGTIKCQPFPGGAGTSNVPGPANFTQSGTGNW